MRFGCSYGAGVTVPGLVAGGVAFLVAGALVPLSNALGRLLASLRIGKGSPEGDVLGLRAYLASRGKKLTSGQSEPEGKV